MNTLFLPIIASLVLNEELTVKSVGSFMNVNMPFVVIDKPVVVSWQREFSLF